ncbi:hypothetical protein K432DRAFT_404161 [Lepidopterella palustris CBS 459.81]|uniref:AA1-like domain-containing protein n=1 Tax=Lepidopterella palustris CBS 459.81 TaxID=1314670 RepID=A0A8E2JFU4_9PEZI|nr:hypothetical protein K432DRAFT_404161 [Lepidopterella palustris CBS 459.81]
MKFLINSRLYILISLLASIQLAAARIPPAFRIPRLFTFSPSGRAGQVNNYIVDFDVWDANPAANTNTTCHVEWNIANATTGWMGKIPCKDPAFSFRLRDFTGVDDFGIVVKHEYERR